MCTIISYISESLILGPAYRGKWRTDDVESGRCGGCDDVPCRPRGNSIRNVNELSAAHGGKLEVAGRKISFSLLYSPVPDHLLAVRHDGWVS